MTRQEAQKEYVFWCLLAEWAQATDARLYAWQTAMFYQRLAEKL